MQAFTRERLNARAAGIAERITLGTALDRYVAEQRARGRTEWANHQSRRNRLCGLQEGRYGPGADFPLERLDTAAMRRIVTARMAEGYAAHSINHEVRMIAAAWRMARDARAAVADPPPLFETVKAAQKTRRLSVEEFRAVHAELAPDKPLPARGGGTYIPPPESKTYLERREAQDAFVVLCLTGMRWGELARLTIDALEADAIEVFGWKTGKPRLVPIAEMAREVIDRRRYRSLSTFFPAETARPGAVPVGPSAGRSTAPAATLRTWSSGSGDARSTAFAIRLPRG